MKKNRFRFVMAIVCILALSAFSTAGICAEVGVTGFRARWPQVRIDAGPTLVHEFHSALLEHREPEALLVGHRGRDLEAGLFLARS